MGGVNEFDGLQFFGYSRYKGKARRNNVARSTRGNGSMARRQTQIWAIHKLTADLGEADLAALCDRLEALIAAPDLGAPRAHSAAAAASAARAKA